MDHEPFMLLVEELAAGGVPAATAVAGAAPAAVGGAPAADAVPGGAPAAAGGAPAPGGAAAGAAAAQQPRQAMRWTPVMSNYVLRRFCHLIATGVRTDKGFKEVHLNQVDRDIK